MNQTRIGSYIARKRREKNLTQEQLAERLGLSNKTVSKWENGKCMPDYSVIEALCQALSITLSELMDGEDAAEDSVRIYDDAQILDLLRRTQELEKQKGILYGLILIVLGIACNALSASTGGSKVQDFISGLLMGLSIAEMLASGTVSFSDMYFFFDGMMPAIRESGIKCNLSRGLTVFDDSDYESLAAYKDNLRLLNEWNGEMGGRLIGDLCIHGEYTSTPKVVEAVAAHAKDAGARIHIHLSETQTEHEECKQRHGLTPAAYMEAHGIFDSPTTAAHCVWLEDEDFDILKKHNVSVACCPASNLKLASGYANIPKMLEKGINIALGTDGAASNNNLNIFQDIYLFGVVYKGFYHDSTLLTPAQVLHTATRAGALSQGRTDCGKLAVGYKADLCVIDTDTPQFTPMTDAACNVVYAAQGADVRLTMVDGEVLYRDGEFKTIDIEKVKAETQKRTDAILRRL